METPGTICEFWFGQHQDEAELIARQSALWWSKRDDVDSGIRVRFEPLLDRASAGELDGWRATPQGRLAFVLLTDQFPRNMFRNTPRAFAFDPLARAWARDAIDQGVDQRLRAIERVFLYMPLEHSESLDDQTEAVRLVGALTDGVAPGLRPDFERFLDFARRHREIIARYGRFPHRNAILGRESDAAEIDFLQRPGSSF